MIYYNHYCKEKRGRKEEKALFFYDHQQSVNKKKLSQCSSYTDAALV